MRKLLIFLLLVYSSAFGQQSESSSISKKLVDFLNSAYAVGKFNGTALIAQKGQVLLNKGYGFKNFSTKSFNDTNSLFQIGSITKSFTAIIILKLQEEGKLSVLDKLNKYFPDYPQGDKISIFNLLTHTSGIHNYTEDISEQDTAIVCHPVTKERVLENFKNKPLSFKPGKRFDYNNSGYFLLGMITEKVTGIPYETVVRQMIFAPLQMYHSGFDFKNLTDTNKTQGYVFINKETAKLNYTIDSTVYYSTGAIYSTTIDMYKWAKAISNHEILNENSWKQAFTQYKNNYGLGFWIDTLFGRSYIKHDGGLIGFTSDFIYYPNENIIIILLTNTGNYGNSLFPVSSGIAAILLGLPYSNWQVQGQNIKINDTILQKYVGTYADNKKNKVFITVKDGQLFAQGSSKQSIPKTLLVPQSETKFLLKDFNAVIEFMKDNDGNIIKIISHESGKDVEIKKVK